jgi:hypothetical protein
VLLLLPLLLEELLLLVLLWEALCEPQQLRMPGRRQTTQVGAACSFTERLDVQRRWPGGTFHAAKVIARVHRTASQVANTS